jgi:hypothetical protein
MISDTDNPTHLTCPWCPAQAYIRGCVNLDPNLVKYECPAHHRFYIEEEDDSFNFGHNKETE